MKYKKRIVILSTPIDCLSMSETIELIDNSITHGEQIHHTVVNASKIVMMHSDDELRKSVVESDIINADGQAVVWASRFLNSPLPERVTGIDLMEKLVELAYLKKYKIFFFGAREDIVEKVVEKYSNKFDKSLIAGFRNGYYSKHEEKLIAEEIGKSGAQILFVAISSPQKENFLFKYKTQLEKVNFIMGVGGSFDVIAGYVKRAPLFLQQIGLEWLFRLLQEPKRMWKRYTIGNFKFLLLVFKYKFRLK